MKINSNGLLKAYTEVNKHGGNGIHRNEHAVQKVFVMLGGFSQMNKVLIGVGGNKTHMGDHGPF